jgi:hypothetical protein
MRTYERNSLFALMCGLFGGCFLIAGLVHATGGIEMGELSREPRMIEMALMELISGGVLVAAAMGQFRRRMWAWKTGLLGHVLGIATAALGLLAPQIGFGMLSDVGHMFYLLMLVLMSLSLIALWRSRPRNAVRRAQHRIAARLY